MRRTRREVTADLHTRLAARYLDPDGLLELSDTAAWAWFELPTVPYEFLSEEAREQLAAGIALGLAGLSDTDCHLLVTHREYSVDDWARDLGAQVTRPAPGWLDYLHAQHYQVSQQAFWRKQVWLGVRLGERSGSVRLAGSLPEPLAGLLRRGERAAGLADEVVSPRERAHWRDRARDLAGSLSAGPLRARPATHDDLVWLLRRGLHRSLPPPPAPAAPLRPWGPGYLTRLVQGRIENGYHWLTVLQPSGIAHVACLAMSGFPKVMEFPRDEPWLYHADKLDYPVEFSLRMRLVSPAQAAQDSERQRTRAAGQITHMEEAGVRPGLKLQEQAATAEQLGYDLREEGLPFVYDRPRLIVSAGDTDTLVARVRRVVEHYRAIGIDVEWPTGDQFPLFLEAMPGDTVRVGAYLQRQALITVAGGLPTASAELGEPVSTDPEARVGPYIGMTSGRTRLPVHYDTLTASRVNEAAAVAILGGLGNGKTNLALLLTHQAVLRGAIAFYLDPKGDGRGLARLLARRTERHPDGLAPSRVLDLAGERPGLLDPFSLAPDPETRLLLAIDLLLLLLPPGLSEERRTALYEAVEAVMRAEADGGPAASLMQVVAWLAQVGERGDQAARGLATELRVTSKLPFAHLLFAPGDGSLRAAPPGLTVVALAGLTFPDSRTPREHYSADERLGLAVFHAVAKKARQLLHGLVQPRLIVVDEAWMLTSTPQGQKLIQEVARMGRSRAVPMLLVSHNARDLMGQQITNCLSAVFAFKSTARGEVDDILELLRVDNTPEHQAVIRGLANGECVFADLDHRVGTVRIDLGSDELRAAFDTNPTTAGTAEDDRAAQPLAAGGEDLPDPAAARLGPEHLRVITSDAHPDR